MSRTLRELIRVLERAANHSPLGDQAQVIVETPLFERDHFYIPGEGDTARGAHYDPDRQVIVIDTTIEDGQI